MGKRVLVSILLTAVVVVAIALAATAIFSGQYNQLAMSQVSPSPSPDFGLDQVVPQPEEALAAGDAADSAGSDQEVQAVVNTPGTGTISTEIMRKVVDMTLEEKVCQMMFVTPEVLTGYNKVVQSGDATRSALQKYPVGGVIYFSNNLVTMDQSQQMLSNIQSFSQELTGIGLFLGVDEEGGSVARAGDKLGTTTFDDMRVYGEEGDAAKAYEIGTTLAEDLGSIGFNVDFAPVADVITNEENTVVKDRSFGSDPELVSSMVAEEVKGFVNSGILCAPKHFPGHGSTGSDTHDGFAASSRTMSELQDCDLKPFQAAIDAGAPMIMVGHMTMTEIDSENPASLSSAVVTGILREQLGYKGIIITDAMNMGAIANSYGSGEAAVKAISAGCDMVLCVSNLASAIEAVEEAVENGTLSEARINESVQRILLAKQNYGLLP